MSLLSDALTTLLRRPLVTINHDATALAALALARSEQVHHLPVLRGSALVGVVCTCDLQGAYPDCCVDVVMTQPAVTLDAGATLLTAAQTMRERDVGSVIVLTEEAPHGIVTRGDLLLAAPDVEAVLGKCRCECCGLTRHLRTDSDGYTLCMYCAEPRAEGYDADTTPTFTARSRPQHAD